MTTRPNITHLLHPNFERVRHDVTVPLHVEVDQVCNLACPASPVELTRPVSLGSAVETTVRALADKVIAMTGSASRLVFRPPPENDPMQRKPDITLARAALGWEPRTGLVTGLARVIGCFGRLDAGAP